MGKRIKKPIVKPEQRKSWLKRYQAGESIDEIARSDFYDARTIKKHVDIAQQESDRREARLTVLKNALEGHYADLCNFAEKLENQVIREELVTLRDERLWSALRQHIPRSPLWVYFNRWGKLIQDKTAIDTRIRGRLTTSLKSDTEFTKIASTTEGLIPFMVEALARQMISWSRGRVALTVSDNFSSEKVGTGLINIRYGAFFVNKVAEIHDLAIKNMLAKNETKIKKWEEYENLVKLFEQIERLKRDISDEIAIITLRRVVPGKCQYCPL